MGYKVVSKELRKKIKPGKAKLLMRFFKTGKGQYGEGDKFLGVMVPQSREVAQKYKDLSLAEVKKILISPYHEERLTGLLILVLKYQKASETEKEKIFKFYLQNTKSINNWDLVDLTAHKIMGDWLLNRPKDILYKLVKSKNIWERRIAVITTFNFIRYNKFDDSLKIAELLLNDKHDLIHKAVGWMLREIGKRDLIAEEKFLNKHYKQMPRTMLRYAIEKFPENKRKFYLA